ncbi:MAG: DUF115 domain-containing protein [Chlamydiia bacterium]|nr:DUF115 domain-containing protein [Chlamydiia bacterium]
MPAQYAIAHLQLLSTWQTEKEGRALVILQQGQQLLGFDIPSACLYRLTDPIDQSLTNLAWDYLFLSIKLWVPEGVFWPYQDLFERAVLGVHLVGSETKDFYAKAIYNTCVNTLKAQESFCLKSLEGALRGVPAIICGAGPTLSEQIPILKSCGSKAVIFAGGAALSALSSEQVPFHISAGVDPDPDPNRSLPPLHHPSPFFYQQRFSSELLGQLSGLKIPVPMAYSGPFNQWLTRLETNPIELDGGWTVATFMTSLATFLGCNPIIWVGVDCSFKEDMYDKTVAEGSKDFKEHVVALGSDIKTKSDWVMASIWLSEWIQKHPDTSFINTSSLSAFGKQDSMSIRQVSQLYLHKDYNIDSMVQQMIQAALLKEKNLDGKDAVAVFHQSLVRIRTYLDQFIDLYRQHHPQDPTTKAEFMLLQYELEQEIFYQTVIEPVWGVWKKVFARSMPKDVEVSLLQQILFFRTITDNYKALEAAL